MQETPAAYRQPVSSTNHDSHRAWHVDRQCTGTLIASVKARIPSEKSRIFEAEEFVTLP